MVCTPLAAVSACLLVEGLHVQVFWEGQVQEGSLLFSFEYSIVAQVRGGKWGVAQGLAIQKS